MTVTADTIIRDALDRYPQTEAVFQKHGLRCHECGGNASDTIEDIALNHGVDLDAFLCDLNAAAARQEPLHP